MNLQNVLSAVSKLSPTEKAAIAAELEELDRRGREERSRTFVPIKPSDPNEWGIESNDQAGFLWSDADERWAFGGNRSGKTELCVQDCDMFCRGEHPVRSEYRKPPVKVRYCAPKWRDGVEAVLLLKFKEVTQRHLLRGGAWQKAWVEKEHKLHYANGSWVHFKSGEEDLNTYGGVDLDAVYQDEHLAEPLYRENRARLADRDGYFCSSMTPEFGITWEQDHVLKPPEGLLVNYWSFDIRGNPYLSKAGVGKFLAALHGSVLYDTKVSGAFCALSGLVLPQWNPEVHIIPDYEIPQTWPRVVCIDMHTRTPSAAMAVAWSPEGELIVYWTAKKFMTVPEWKAYLRGKLAGDKILYWMLDEPGGGEGKDANNQESFKNQFNAAPHPIPMVRVKKGGDSYFASGIYKLWDMLTPDPMTPCKSKIRVFKSCDYPPERINGKICGSLIWEMGRYQYKQEKKADEETLREKVRLVDDHYIDDLRMIAVVGPPHAGAPIKSGLAGRW